MLSKMYLEKNPKMDCFDNNVLLYLAEKEKLDSSFYFFMMYNIVYLEDDDLMRNHNLDYGHPYRINGLDAITGIYHMKYTIYEKDDFASSEDIIKSICEWINKGNMVAVTVDSYGCTWSHFYLDQHMFHTITLESYDPERKIFLSSDS